MDPRRRFTATERAALYLAAEGRCMECGDELGPGWHADHIDPHSRGGLTDVINGQALCPPCNLRKGNRVTNDDLRDWQREAIRQFRSSTSTDFLVCATPGAGKTFLALTLAKRALDERTVERIVVIVPTDALRRQWADEAAQFGIDLMPVQVGADYTKSGYHGCVVTYAQLAVGAGADLLRATTRIPTLALLDEIHHAGDNRSWGKGIEHALEFAVRRVGLTGTPWREDKASPIPFVTYNPEGKVVVDSKYEYGEAVSDGVCRRIEFHAYDGEARWVDCGKVVSAELGEDLSDEDVPAVLETILDPDRDWMPGVLDAAVAALRDLRMEVPDAGGLVIAERQWQAQKYAQQLQEMTGEPVTVAVSDDSDAAARIDAFRSGTSSWLVAVKMVSEGVDIKRLAVGVYAAKTRTPLFFRQVVGRFVRTRPAEDINAKLFIPAVPAFMAHAKKIEEELRHQLDLAREETAKTRQAAEDGQQRFELREPLSASTATFATSIFGGREATAEDHARAEAWCRSRGIPAMYAANVLQDVMAEPATVAEVVVTPTPPVAPRHKLEKQLRGEIKNLVNKLAYRERLEPKEINLALYKRYGPRDRCGIDQLEAMLAELAAAWDAQGQP